MFRRSAKSSARPQLRVSTISILTALYLVLVDNQLFWQSLRQRLPFDNFGHYTFALVVGILLVLLLNIVIQLLAFKMTFKPFLIIVLLTAASVSYFMDSFGVVIDKAMIHNILETDVREASELFSLPLLKHLLIYGGIPISLLLLTRVNYHPWRRELLTRGAIILGSLVLASGLIYAEFKNLALFGRENREMRMFFNPAYATYSLHKVLSQKYFSSAQGPIQEIAADAVRTQGEKSVVVLVVGETARAQSFSLNGYQRETNRYLDKQPLLNFSNTRACGTSTAESLPCMFSIMNRSNFNREKASQYENLLDVLKFTGVDVVWRDNNSGSKGVADRVTYQNFNNADDRELCDAGNCFDEVLIKGMDELMASQKGDMLIVFHLKGSHGPSYYKRVPDSFKVFTPECTKGNIQDCARQDIINAYDNTILYTDYVLSELTRLLDRQPFATAMLYVSDHGESLGENGVYLHGLPYAFAPAEQIQIPMIFWSSERFISSKRLDWPALEKQTGKPYSHDNLFHSILGLFDVCTEAYRPELDIFREYRSS